MNRIAVLTPPGNAAIAAIGIAGPAAWQTVRDLFRVRGRAELPQNPPESRFWFGTFGNGLADEVILTRKSSDHLEIHCHGGQAVIAWICALLRAHGFERVDWREWPTPFADPAAGALLPYARTMRTAAILLDQAHGAYLRALLEPEIHREVLSRNENVGRHLVQPWTIAIAGAPNAGKSTLMNALAGFTRSLVSSTPGTTRDTVAVSLAFDGWGVEVIDTAGIRSAPDELEEEGIRRAQAAMAESDLCLWVIDATNPVRMLGALPKESLIVWNKCDLVVAGIEDSSNSITISAATGQGMPELIERISKTLVPHPPRPGEPVPYR